MKRTRPAWACPSRSKSESAGGDLKTDSRQLLTMISERRGAIKLTVASGEERSAVEHFGADAAHRP